MGFAYFEVVRWTLCFFYWAWPGFFSALIAVACHRSEAGATLDGNDAGHWRAQIESAEGRTAALQRLSTAGPEATPLLIELLQVPRGKTPIVAAQLLGDRGLDAVPALTDALGARSDSVRIAAAAALGLIGPPAQSALPALRQLRDSEQPTNLRIASCVGIWGISREPSEIMPTMLDGLRSGSPEVVFAATGLAALVGARAVSPLVVALESDDPKFRAAAANALGAIGADAAPARRKLEALLEDREPTVRAAAQGALNALE